MLMTPKQWRDMIEEDAPGICHEPPECQGQIVMRSYVQHEEYIFERVDNAIDGSIVINVYLGTEGAFEPWIRAPDLGELMWTETLS